MCLIKDKYYHHKYALALFFFPGQKHVTSTTSHFTNETIQSGLIPESGPCTQHWHPQKILPLCLSCKKPIAFNLSAFHKSPCTKLCPSVMRSSLSFVSYSVSFVKLKLAFQSCDRYVKMFTSALCELDF